MIDAFKNCSLTNVVFLCWASNIPPLQNNQSVLNLFWVNSELRYQRINSIVAVFDAKKKAPILKWLWFSPGRYMRWGLYNLSVSLSNHKMETGWPEGRWEGSKKVFFQLNFFWFHNSYRPPPGQISLLKFYDFIFNKRKC